MIFYGSSCNCCRRSDPLCVARCVLVAPQIGCDEGWGLCGTAPGVPTRVFLRSTPDSAATELFASYTGAAAMSYPEAVLYCRYARVMMQTWVH